jgi:hypothetical protein
VDGNPPKLFELTNGNPPPEVRKRAVSDPGRVVRLWDQTYRNRIAECPVFLATEAEFIELKHPPQLCPADMVDIFGRIRNTLNPPTITFEELEHLLRLAKWISGTP